MLRRFAGCEALSSPHYSQSCRRNINRLEYSTRMAPKGKVADKKATAKGKGKGKTDEKEETGSKMKGAQLINVRHILVRLLI